MTERGGGYVRVDVAGVRWGFYPGVHAYTFFQTLQPLRPWENHPFSVVPTALLRPSPLERRGSGLEDGSKMGSIRDDAEKGQGVAARIRRAQQTGVTQRLSSRCSSRGQLV